MATSFIETKRTHITRNALKSNKIPPPPSRKRLHYIDIAKGVLILLLLVHHYGSATRELGVKLMYDRLVMIWQPLFICFFMQCFFLISGYCSDFNKTKQSFYLGILKQLIIPYVAFNIIWLFATMIMSGIVSIESFLSPISTPPYTSMWFFIALAFSKIVIYEMNRVRLNSKLQCVLCLILLITSLLLNLYNIGDNILCYWNCLGAVFFVWLGYCFKSNSYLFAVLLKYCWIYVPFFVVSYISVGIPTFTAGIQVTLAQLPFFMMLSISGSLLLLRLCRFMSQNKSIEYFGRNSLIIYGLHYPILLLIIKYLSTLVLPSNIFLYTFYILGVYVLEILSCILLIKLFKFKYMGYLIGKF